MDTTEEPAILKKMKLNKVQTAAYELIQSDARFLYTLTEIDKRAKNISSNYIMMCQPYIGVFANGSEQWCKKLGLNAPTFNEKEKAYYSALRQSHKLFEKTYFEFASLLMEKLQESDRYFYSIRSLREMIFGYYNVGTDLCNGNYCGNTILCAAHTPMPLLRNQDAGTTIRSTGTWCLFGTELDEPLINSRTMSGNLSNETGFGGKTTLLKNIVGLWFIQQCRSQWKEEGREYSYSQLEEMSKPCPAFDCLIDPSASEFIGAGNMPKRIVSFLKATGQSVPKSEGGFIRCIYESLALRFRAVKEEIESVTGKSFERIYMLGGGTKDKTLAQFTADACGCEVHCGPVEATSYGNAAIQFIANGDISDLAEARRIIRNSVSPSVFTPRDSDLWNTAYDSFKKVCKISKER